VIGDLNQFCSRLAPKRIAKQRLDGLGAQQAFSFRGAGQFIG
jgi:hypothetical protein